MDRVRLNDVVPMLFAQEYMAGICNGTCIAWVCVVFPERFMHSVIARAKSRLLHHIEHRSYDVNHTDIPSICVHTSCDRCAASTLPDDEDILRVRMYHRAQTAECTVHR